MIRCPLWDYFGTSEFLWYLIPHHGLSLAVVGVLFVSVAKVWMGVNMHPSWNALLGRFSGFIYFWHLPLVLPAVSTGLFACSFIYSLACLLNIGMSLVVCIGIQLASPRFVDRGFGSSLRQVLTL